VVQIKWLINNKIIAPLNCTSFKGYTHYLLFIFLEPRVEIKTGMRPLFVCFK